MNYCPKERQKFRPLAISDLFVLTLAVSMSLACYAPRIRFLLKSSDEFAKHNRWLETSRDISNSLAAGVSIFGFAILCRERLRKRLELLSPGQLYFAIAGPASVLMLVAATNRLSFLARYPAGMLMDGIIAFGIGTTLALSARAVIATDFHWRPSLACFWLALLLVTAMCVYDFGRFFDAWTGNFRVIRVLVEPRAIAIPLVAVTAYVAAAVDIYKTTARDWLHYVALVPITLKAFAYILYLGTWPFARWQGMLVHLSSSLE